MKVEKYHEPVLLSEALEYLDIEYLARLHGTWVLDATVGFAGHTIEIAKRGVNVVGIDADPEVIKIAEARVRQACPASKGFGSILLANANFRDIDAVLKYHRIESVDGVLFDLGVSSFHFEERDRGFSFRYHDAPLDMRLNRSTQAVTAATLLNVLSKSQLESMFSEVVGNHTARKLAVEIVKHREEKKFAVVGDLIEVVRAVGLKSGKIDPATKVFMALRIAVNSELDNLNVALAKSFSYLNKDARMVVISFHSGEDTIVKNFFRRVENEGLAEIITKKPVVPSEKEVALNPKSRSAKLRCIKKRICQEEKPNL
jgi:16S rRNA (cytosine1402-N4)-methyltransferase